MSVTRRVWLLSVATLLIFSSGGGPATTPHDSSKVESDLKTAKIVVSFKDQDKTVRLLQNDLLGVSLDGNWSNLISSNPDVLSLADGPVLTSDNLTIATFRAAAFGQSPVTANTKACATCGSAEAVFRVVVIVTSSQSLRAKVSTKLSNPARLSRRSRPGNERRRPCASKGVHPITAAYDGRRATGEDNDRAARHKRAP
jgi:hypothetical protein